MARILVEGRYVCKDCYVLTKEDGTVYKEIREGDSIHIDNQLRNWEVVRNGRKLVMVKGNERYTLPHNRKLLWATTSGAVRNGLFHFFRELSPLETQLKRWQVPTSKIHYVDSIDVTLEDGGLLCHHAGDKRNGYENWTDSSEELVYEGARAPEWHSNQFHRGCKVEPDTIRFYGGTFLLHFRDKCTMNGSLVSHLDEVWITSKCDQAELTRRLSEE